MVDTKGFLTMSITSDGLTIIIRAPDSLAIALASKVFPVPNSDCVNIYVDQRGCLTYQVVLIASR